MRRRRKKEEIGGDVPGRVPLPEWLAVRLDIPPDLLEGGLRAELRGREALTVHGCRAILGYQPALIRLAVKSGELCVRGQRLVCTSYLAGAVGINGHIDGICFSDGACAAGRADTGAETSLRERETAGAETPGHEAGKGGS